MIGGQSTGGPKDPPRHIGIKDIRRLNQSTINGRMGDLQGIKAREISEVEGGFRASGKREGPLIFPISKFWIWPAGFPDMSFRPPFARRRDLLWNARIL